MGDWLWYIADSNIVLILSRLKLRRIGIESPLSVFCVFVCVEQLGKKVKRERLPFVLTPDFVYVMRTKVSFFTFCRLAENFFLCVQAVKNCRTIWVPKHATATAAIYLSN